MKTINLFLLSILLCSPNITIAQNTLDSAQIKTIADWVEKQNEKKFLIGFSIGVRTGFEWEKESRAFASISPDTTRVVILDYQDMMSVILSSSITYFPWKGKEKQHPLWWLGFTANINFLEIADKEAGTIFNKSIDGGMGLAFAFGNQEKFVFGLTYERTSQRRPRDWVLNQVGNPIWVDGQKLKSIDVSDDQYYIDTGLNAISFKFIYHF